MKTTHIVKISLLSLLLVLQACVSVSLNGDRFVSNKNVKFNSGNATLSESFFAFISPSGQILGQVADILKAHPDIRRVRIEGHTDAVGDAAQNQVLSTQRAATVATWLRAQPPRRVRRGRARRRGRTGRRRHRDPVSTLPARDPFQFPANTALRRHSRFTSVRHRPARAL
jgi:hypothetical protein